MTRPIAETIALHLALAGLLMGAVVVAPLLALGWLDDRLTRAPKARQLAWRK